VTSIDAVLSLDVQIDNASILALRASIHAGIIGVSVTPGAGALDGRGAGIVSRTVAVYE
jgi:hypothetical protein